MNENISHGINVYIFLIIMYVITINSLRQINSIQGKRLITVVGISSYSSIQSVFREINSPFCKVIYISAQDTRKVMTHP